MALKVEIRTNPANQSSSQAMAVGRQRDCRPKRIPRPKSNASCHLTDVEMGRDERKRIPSIVKTVRKVANVSVIINCDCLTKIGSRVTHNPANRLRMIRNRLDRKTLPHRPVQM
jgi:hypothetical protein